MTTKRIFVTGDIANDYFLVRGKRMYSDDQNFEGTIFNHHRGGAYLIFDFLKAISKSIKTKEKGEHLKNVFGYNVDIFNKLPDRNNGYVAVSQFKKENEDKVFWRIDEFLGFGSSEIKEKDLTHHSIPVPMDTDIIIIDDAGMNFTNNCNEPLWNSVIESAIKIKSTNSNSLVIYKKSSNFENSNFYDALLKASYSEKLNLLTILSINDIRKLDVKVSTGLSWEQSALDLAAELRTNEALSSVMKSKFLVITFQSSGALFVVNNGDNNYDYKLIFDPEKMEGEDVENEQGSTIGNMSFFTAAFSSKLDLAKKEKFYQIENAIKAGLTSMRIFHLKGYEKSNAGVSYPFESVAGELKTLKNFVFSSTSVPNPDTLGENQSWSILIDNYSDKLIEEKVQMRALNALAKNIVLKGKEILKNVPSASFGNLYTIDRSEIESFRNLKKLMKTYVSCEECKKPLSLGVFGPPGAGKSFAVEEIGQGIMGKKYRLLPFNLSQFKDSSDLIGALHQVRDSVLKKEIPIVFWDEFDSQGYKWLQYLLAPMQDGLFQEGQLTHPVGKCIFIFAGATSYNMEAFGEFKKEDEEAKKEFIMKKGPDFKSRLNGYINILGPNKRQIFNSEYTKEENKWIDDPTDIMYPIRRAIFIIGLLRLKKSNFPFEMDWGLLNGLIKVDRYKHGSRSLANLLSDIKQNNPRNLLLRSWLPSKPTLELYFNDPDDLYKNLTRETDFIEMAWEMAPIIHSFYCYNLTNITKEYSGDYSFLPVFIKESNVQAAIRIPEVLKAGGFKLVRKDSSEKVNRTEYMEILNLIESEVDKEKNDSYFQKSFGSPLEEMAEQEHNLWMKFYKENGWEYNAIRNDYAKRHNCIVSYEELPQPEKAKDRKIIARYLDIVDIAGFAIAKIQ